MKLFETSHSLIKFSHHSLRGFVSCKGGCIGRESPSKARSDSAEKNAPSVFLQKLPRNEPRAVLARSNLFLVARLDDVNRICAQPCEHAGTSAREEYERDSQFVSPVHVFQAFHLQREPLVRSEVAPKRERFAKECTVETSEQLSYSVTFYRLTITVQSACVLWLRFQVVCLHSDSHQFDRTTDRRLRCPCNQRF